MLQTRVDSHNTIALAQSPRGMRAITRHACIHAAFTCVAFTGPIWIALTTNLAYTPAISSCECPHTHPSCLPSPSFSFPPPPLPAVSRQAGERVTAAIQLLADEHPRLAQEQRDKEEAARTRRYQGEAPDDDVVVDSSGAM